MKCQKKILSFKPCYKWNTFNTVLYGTTDLWFLVLNLVISGIPSILVDERLYDDNEVSFKPCYKWNTFNTMLIFHLQSFTLSFKPCYKWNTFNTVKYVSIIKEF